MKIKGYLNEVNITPKWIKKTFMSEENKINEIKFLESLNRKNFIEGNNLVIEKIKGETIKNFNGEMKKSLFKKIEMFHKLKINNIKTFDWHKYMEHSGILSDERLAKYKKLIPYLSPELVTSHNDINFHNMLWDGKEIHLIDFEWSSLNHPYFDYINIYIHEDIKVKEDLDLTEWNKLLYLTLCFFLMWTENYKDNEYVQNLKTKYLLLLSDIII